MLGFTAGFQHVCCPLSPDTQGLSSVDQCLHHRRGFFCCSRPHCGGTMLSRAGVVTEGTWICRGRLALMVYSSSLVGFSRHISTSSRSMSPLISRPLATRPTRVTPHSTGMPSSLRAERWQAVSESSTDIQCQPNRAFFSPHLKVNHTYLMRVLKQRFYHHILLIHLLLWNMHTSPPLRLRYRKKYCPFDYIWAEQELNHKGTWDRHARHK